MKLFKTEICLIHAQRWQRGFWIDKITTKLTYVGVGLFILTLESIDT